ncbi:MAG: hypothetical protein JWM11_2508 [Planctomycetaceae bacterium]|nr:hypothetical protein [Planctomycetaceae bacterium]
MLYFRQFSKLKRLTLSLALLGYLGASALAQDLGIPYQPRALGGEFSRAGNPQCVAPWARSSTERHDGSYYVGGSRALRGDGRTATEGTWGSDYAPWYTRVSLRWNHGRRYQSGGGQYESDRRNNPVKIGPQ